MSNKTEGKSVILLSSFQTWAGKRYAQPIVDIEKHFHTRSSSRGASAIYPLENNFYNMCKLNQKGCIVGIGLVYGAKGFDFERAFT